LKLLLELRPALDGHAGIPQENRLLFRGLRSSDSFDVEGLIQSGHLLLPEGLPVVDGCIRCSLTADQETNRVSRIVVTLAEETRPRGIARQIRRLVTGMVLIHLCVATILRRRHRLTGFLPGRFSDFFWRRLFAKTLPAQDLELVTRARMRVLRPPYALMHMVGLMARRLGVSMYPKLDTRGVDVVIAQTPFPATVSESTKLVVRYLDAVPLLMPDTIISKSFHQALHYTALRHNVTRGSYFVCASDATRNDLIAVFPQAAARAVTIHCMISHHYYLEDSSPRRVPDILEKRISHRTQLRDHTQLEAARAGAGDFSYLLMVSTLEPRKNHSTLFAAWEHLRAERYPDLKLVLVGGLGWGHESILRPLDSWMARAQAFLLHDVPADELRLLYRHARVTVCPSLGEGFDYSGVEAMRCGGVVAASSIPVHREVYDSAAEYFNPYSVTDTAAAIDRVLDPERREVRSQLLAAGAEVSARYLPDRILPRWDGFLRGLRP
jgi:glycosyltransferase involved in cell wall biosynthesis